MIYIDSDGVISDFSGWVNKHIDELPKDNIDTVYDIDLLMVNHYDEVFYDCNKCKNADNFLRILNEYEDSKVLTAVPNPERLKKEFPNIKDIDYRVHYMKINKYLWFEKHGITRSKVIITERSSEKTKYCNSSNDILFDDRQINIDRWIKAGGIGILIKN